jgi:hypothetical protein
MSTAKYMAYLIIKACGLMSFMTPDPEIFVATLTEADAMTTTFEGHPGGAYREVLRWSFERQGLYQPPGTPRPVMREGAPPEVDVYIDDGRAGHYMPYFGEYEGVSRVWNRTTPDGGREHQTPITGAANFIYGVVRNRGTTPAAGVMVRSFQSRAPAASIWPTDWKDTNSPPINLPAIAPSGEAVFGPIRWTPEHADAKVLISVSATGDVSNIETVTSGPVNALRLASLDNNIVIRTM